MSGGAAFVFLLVFGAATLFGDGLRDPERLWTGRNGKSFRGSYVRTVDHGTTVEILDSRGRMLRVAVANLSDADRALVQGPPPEVPATAEAFKPLPVLDRTRIPIIDQGEYGQKASDCVPSSFCNFLLWWDQENILGIPKRKDFEDKAEWVHSRMARYCGTRNTAGTSADDAKEGFEEYFRKELEGVATLRVHRDHDLRPENLSRYTRGVDAVMLEMTTIRTNGSVGGHWVALVAMEPDGKLVFNTWGTRFKGVMKVLKEDRSKVTVGAQQVDATTYEIEVSNRSELPAWVAESGIRLVLDPRKADGVTVVRPYVFSEKGKSSPLPADPFCEVRK